MSRKKDFHSMYEVDPNTQCWIWMGTISLHGYGRIGNSQAHRVAYELHIGPIEHGLGLDHLCRNRACVNPAHLEPVTSKENTRRGLKGVLGVCSLYCAMGHLLIPCNIRYDSRGIRVCKLCHRFYAGAVGVHNKEKTHCLRGHPLEGDNLRLRRYSNGSVDRYCIACGKQRSAERRKRMRGTANVVQK